MRNQLFIPPGVSMLRWSPILPSYRLHVPSGLHLHAGCCIPEEAKWFLQEQHLEIRSHIGQGLLWPATAWASPLTLPVSCSQFLISLPKAPPCHAARRALSAVSGKAHKQAGQEQPPGAGVALAPCHMWLITPGDSSP